MSSISRPHSHCQLLSPGASDEATAVWKKNSPIIRRQEPRADSQTRVGGHPPEPENSGVDQKSRGVEDSAVVGTSTALASGVLSLSWEVWEPLMTSRGLLS